MGILEFLSEIFITLRDLIGTICVILLVIFILFWLFGRNKIRYKVVDFGVKEPKKQEKIIDIKVENEENVFRKYDEEKNRFK